MTAWLILGGATTIIIAAIMARLSWFRRGQRSIIVREAKAEQKKAAKRIAEQAKVIEEAKQAAREAFERREEVEREVAEDRERAGIGADPVGSLRKRLGRLLGNRGGGTPGGGEGTH